LVGKIEVKLMRGFKVAGLVFGAFLMMTLPASAAGRFRGGIAVGPAFSSWGWHNPYLYAPYGWYGSYGPYLSYYSSLGELKLKTNVKDADVYLNGAYAGKAAKLKTMWLRPDSYNLEVRAAGYAPYAERIYLMPGKTMKVNVDFSAAPKS
jgi:hypothetical protein